MINLEISLHGHKGWICNDTYHRTNGPAIVRPNGQVEYWTNNMPHRTDGPAIIRPDGTVEYWGNNQLVTEYELMFLKH